VIGAGDQARGSIGGAVALEPDLLTRDDVRGLPDYLALLQLRAGDGAEGL